MSDHLAVLHITIMTERIPEGQRITYIQINVLLYRLLIGGVNISQGVSQYIILVKKN